MGCFTNVRSSFDNTFFTSIYIRSEYKLISAVYFRKIHSLVKYESAFQPKCPVLLRELNCVSHKTRDSPFLVGITKMMIKFKKSLTLHPRDHSPPTLELADPVQFEVSFPPQYPSGHPREMTDERRVEMANQ